MTAEKLVTTRLFTTSVIDGRNELDEVISVKIVCRVVAVLDPRTSTMAPGQALRTADFCEGTSRSPTTWF